MVLQKNYPKIITKCKLKSDKLSSKYGFIKFYIFYSKINYNCTFKFLRRMTRSDTLDVYKVKNESVNNTKQLIHFNLSYFKKLCYDHFIIITYNNLPGQTR